MNLSPPPPPPQYVGSFVESVNTISTQQYKWHGLTSGFDRLFDSLFWTCFPLVPVRVSNLSVSLLSAMLSYLELSLPPGLPPPPFSPSLLVQILLM